MKLLAAFALSTSLVTCVFAQKQPTAEEKAFSEVIAKMYPGREMRKLPQNTTDNIGFGLGGIPEFVSMSNDPEITSAFFLSQVGCQADAVIFGRTTSMAAHLSVDESFLYTQYDFVIDSVVKNNTPETLAFTKTIQVVRPGGNIVLSGFHVEVRDFAFQLLETQKSYLLFLRYVPAAHGFLVLREGDLELSETGVKKLSQGKGDGRIFKAGSNAQSVLTEARQAVSKTCGAIYWGLQQ